MTVILLPEYHLIYRTAWTKQTALNHKGGGRGEANILKVIAFIVQWWKVGEGIVLLVAFSVT